MAFGSKAVTVDDTRDKILDGSEGASALVTNLDATDTVYLGGDTVTTANGYPLAPGAGVGAPLGGRDDDLYGITAAGLSADVRVLVNT